MGYFILYLIFHLSCAVLSAGMVFAYVQKEWSSLAKEEYRQDLSKSWGISLIGGPISLAVAFFMTGFVEHGFKWR